PAAAAVTVPAAPKVAAGPTAPAPKARAAASPTPPAPPATQAAVALPVADGSGAKAPTCEELWAGEPPRGGKYPGAAFQQSRAANKWITRGDLDQAQHA